MYDIVDPVVSQGRGSATRWAPPPPIAPHHDGSTAPVIGSRDFVRVSAEVDIWDAWPVQDADGAPALLGAATTLWMALAAPRSDNPDDRHGHARIHLFESARGRWRHLGPVMPDGFSPGSREWSGSALLAADRKTLTLYFTAAGRRGEGEPSFEQRLFAARADLRADQTGYRLADWRDLREIVIRDPAFYMASDAGRGRIGTIKAFRDPAYFHDPADGQHYLFFAGSSAASPGEFNGVVGAATADPRRPDDWILLPPVIDASGVNNELERPHVVWHDGLYYLFWSTQAHVFAPAQAGAPTGLYGMVAARLDGGWSPLNGSGLVFANPPEAPSQAYSWLVLPDLSVASFVDDWGRANGSPAPRRFGATFAPWLHLRLEGDRAWLGEKAADAASGERQ